MTAKIRSGKRAAREEVIFAARLVMLAWLGDSVDGGKALRTEALPRLVRAFAEFEK
jgi:hypothetical protein